jgi:hypothetical protein
MCADGANGCGRYVFRVDGVSRKWERGVLDEGGPAGVEDLLKRSGAVAVYNCTFPRVRNPHPSPTISCGFRGHFSDVQQFAAFL